MPETNPVSIPQSPYAPEHKQYTFHADPSASEHLCENCRLRDAELSFGFWSPEDEFDESGFCCTLCAMALVSELSNVERAVKIETSDGRWCEIKMGSGDDHSVAFGSR
jgi:hypothetical protein